jgi:hypothetical protein
MSSLSIVSVFIVYQLAQIHSELIISWFDNISNIAVTVHQ